MYAEALTRGIHYNYEYRMKLVNNALQAGQLRSAEFAMYPDLKTNASLYSRNNQNTAYGITASGQPAGVFDNSQLLRIIAKACLDLLDRASVMSRHDNKRIKSW